MGRLLAGNTRKDKDRETYDSRPRQTRSAEVRFSSGHYRHFQTRQEALGSIGDALGEVMVRGFPTVHFLIGDAAESCRLSRSDEARAMPAHRRGRSHRTEQALITPACATFASAIRGTGGTAGAHSRIGAAVETAEDAAGHRRKREASLSPEGNRDMGGKKGSRDGRVLSALVNSTPSGRSYHAVPSKCQQSFPSKWRCQRGCRILADLRRRAGPAPPAHGARGAGRGTLV